MRPPHASCAAEARAPVHAVPRRRLPIGRRGGELGDIGDGLPSDFGFPLALDPADPDSAYLIPLTADTDRVTPHARVGVYETRDAGATWTERGDGLPDEQAYLTILREAFDWTGEGEGLELYFGATSGDLSVGDAGKLADGGDAAAAGAVGLRVLSGPPGRLAAGPVASHVPRLRA